MKITRRSAGRSGIGVLALVLSVCLAATASGESTRAAFERFAAGFSFFGVRELVYDRTEIYLADPEAMKAYRPLLAEFRARQDSVDEIVQLLLHADAKVRLLAIMALYMKEEPHVLPRIASLMDDTAQTYPDPPYDKERVRMSGIGPPHEPKTVGEAATAVISFYVKPAEFTTYWEARKDRQFCAGWFAVQVRRATRGTSPMPEGSVDRLRAIRRKIDQVPMPDRRWILLELARREYGEYGTSHLIPEFQLARLCREVGSTTLREMIRGYDRGDGPNAPFISPDPDLDIESLRWFIYEHARDLLVAADAEDVLGAGNVIAAAELRPAMASQWLRPRLEKGRTSAWEQAKEAAALWRIAGPAEADFVVNWYFRAPPNPGSIPSGRAAFLETAVTEPRPELRSLLARIVSDLRLGQTGPESTRTLLQIINPWLPTPLVGEEEIRESYGHDELDSRSSSKFKPLAEWHRKLRTSVGAWKAER